jgi:DNA-binding transcriptional ArsR family regulator
LHQLVEYVIKHLSKYEITVKCIGPTTSEAEIEHWKDEVLFSPQLDELAEFLNLVGNSTRLKIVFLLTKFKELCVCDLAQILDVTVPAVSQQLAKLKAFGLLKSRRENQTIFYSIADTRNVELLKGRFDQILEQTQ